MFQQNTKSAHVMNLKCFTWISIKDKFLYLMHLGAPVQKFRQKPQHRIHANLLNSKPIASLSLFYHLGQQTEGNIRCLDPELVTLQCAGTSVLSRAGTADQIIKQGCQLVKIQYQQILSLAFGNIIPLPSNKKLPAFLSQSSALKNEFTMLTSIPQIISPV